jgi:hypothetical protein
MKPNTDQPKGKELEYRVIAGKFPPVKTGGIYRNRLCLSAKGGCFHPPVKTGGIKIGIINKSGEGSESNTVKVVL